MAKNTAQKSPPKSTTNTLAVGVGAAAAAAAAAAGAYWFYGSADARRHRQGAHSWMLKARAEVLEALEHAAQKLGDIDKEKYMDIVEAVLARYSQTAGVTSAQMADIKRDLTATWRHMEAARKTGTHAAKGIKRAAAKGAKKKSPKRSTVKEN